MTSSTIRKQCVDNNGCKQAAVTNCEGCSKAFCIKHFNDHRRLLDKEMNVIIDEHDVLKNSLNQQTTKTDSHPLIKKIDNWEKESIVKVQKRAKDLRQELLQSTTAQTDDLSKKLQQLAEQLKQGRENNDFIEADLQFWKQILNDLKTDPFRSSTICINRRDNISLIQNIFVNSIDVSNELFERVSNKRVRIEENGQVVISDASQILTEIRGRNDYESGCHKIRLLIEQLSGDWMFFGINSKSTSLKDDSQFSKSAYGWSCSNYIWMNEISQLNNSNSVIEMRTNDIITLIFDCGNRKTSMINKRTKAKHELSVEVVDCPFPWQLHVNLYEPNSRMCIL
jgi:hypothetical protein